MEYRQMGNSGLQVSAVGLGGNTFGRYADEKGTADIIHRAIDLGINHVDTANTYSRGRSEDHVGKAVKGRRSQVVITTKVGGAVAEGPYGSGASRRHIMEEVEKSLKRLDTDYIDLYIIHFVDPKTPIDETLMTLDDLVHQGKVRYIGCSNFSAWQVCEATWTSKTMHLNSFVSVQPQYNLLERRIERELIPFCQEYNIGIVPYSPLAGGFLTGKYRPDAPVQEGVRGYNNQMFQQRTLTERNFATLSKLESYATARGHTVGELAVAWLLSRPAVTTVITGATKPEQVEENAKAGEWKLIPEEVAEIDEIAR